LINYVLYDDDMVTARYLSSRFYC